MFIPISGVVGLILLYACYKLRTLLGAIIVSLAMLIVAYWITLPAIENPTPTKIQNVLESGKGAGDADWWPKWLK